MSYRRFGIGVSSVACRSTLAGRRRRRFCKPPTRAAMRPRRTAATAFKPGMIRTLPCASGTAKCSGARASRTRSTTTDSCCTRSGSRRCGVRPAACGSKCCCGWSMATARWSPRACFSRPPNAWVSRHASSSTIRAHRLAAARGVARRGGLRQRED